MAAARALAGKARADAASRPCVVAAALRAPSLGADRPSLAAVLQATTRAAPPALAPALLGSRAPPPLGADGSARAPALLGSRAPPPLGADGSLRAAALLGSRAPPPLGAGSPRAAAHLGPRAPTLDAGSPRAAELLDPRARPLWLGAGPRVPCLLRFPPTPLVALGARRFSTGVGGEPDDKAGHVDGDKSREHTSKSKAVVDEAAAARATKSAPEINTAVVVSCTKPKVVSTGAASELPGNDHVLPGFNHVEEPRGNCLGADDVAPHDFSPSSDVEGARGITGEVDVPAERSASSATRAPKIRAAVVVRRAAPKDVSTGAASELPGNDNVLPGCNSADHVDEQGNGGNGEQQGNGGKATGAGEEDSDLKNFIRNEMHLQGLLLIKLFEQSKEERNERARSEANRHLVYSIIVGVIIQLGSTLLNKKKENETAHAIDVGAKPEKHAAGPKNGTEKPEAEAGGSGERVKSDRVNVEKGGKGGGGDKAKASINAEKGGKGSSGDKAKASVNAEKGGKDGGGNTASGNGINAEKGGKGGGGDKAKGGCSEEASKGGAEAAKGGERGDGSAPAAAVEGKDAL